MLPFNVWAQSLWETLYMVGFSLIIGSIVGFFIAIVLWLTRKGGLKENPLLYTILNGFINIIRSTPVSYTHLTLPTIA